MLLYKKIWHVYFFGYIFPYKQIMLNIPWAKEREVWVGAFPAVSGTSIMCNFSLLPGFLGLYHSRLAQSCAAEPETILQNHASFPSRYQLQSSTHCSSPILAAHCNLPEYTGSAGLPSCVTACPRWRKNGGRHQYVSSICQPCLVNILHRSFRWIA